MYVSLLCGQLWSAIKQDISGHWSIGLLLVYVSW